MKTTFKLKAILLLITGLILAFNAKSQTIELSLRNDSMTTSNRYEFDIYVTLTSAGSLNFRGLQIGILIDSIFVGRNSSVCAPGTGAVELVSGTNGFAGSAWNSFTYAVGGSQPNPGYGYVNISQNPSPSAAVPTVLTSGVAKKLGRIRVIGSSNFSCIRKPNISIYN